MQGRRGVAALAQTGICEASESDARVRNWSRKAVIREFAENQKRLRW